ncbi:MAG: response regulator [Planctomycetes bacterium]|nr:response regulator [Planctomycetota bacterium]
MAERQARPNWVEKQLFTTGEAAEVCRVSQQTIIRCFDSGRLEGYRVPGSRFRKIPRDALLRFMRANAIATDLLEGTTVRVLVVHNDRSILDRISEALAIEDRLEVTTASTGYDAGVLTERVKPHLIMLDTFLPDVNGSLVCDRIKDNPDLRDTKVLFFDGDRGGAKNKVDAYAAESGADGVVRKPYGGRKLVNQVRALVQL